MQLYEQYRPRSWAEVIAQEKAVIKAQTTLKRGCGARSWWISGKSGTGKTTLAQLIAAEGADPFFTLEIDASDLTPAKLRELG